MGDQGHEIRFELVKLLQLLIQLFQIDHHSSQLTRAFVNLLFKDRVHRLQLSARMVQLPHSHLELGFASLDIRQVIRCGYNQRLFLSLVNDRLQRKGYGEGLSIGI
jgi:hypothetical protein